MGPRDIDVLRDPDVAHLEAVQNLVGPSMDTRDAAYTRVHPRQRMRDARGPDSVAVGRDDPAAATDGVPILRHPMAQDGASVRRDDERLDAERR
jgi:hypothetical protein